MSHKEVENKPIHGNPPDEQLANGPIENRSCRDLICFILFVAATVAFVVIISMGFNQGKPERLSYAYDPNGRACGHDDGVFNAPYIYLVAPLVGYLNRSVCVSQCPNWKEGAKQPTRLKCVVNKVITNCSERYSYDGVNDIRDFDVDFLINSNNYANEPSVDKLFNYSTFIYNSTSVLNRLCIPSGDEYVSKIYGNMDDIASVQVFQQWVADIRLTYKILFASVGIAFAIGLFYMLVMRYCAGTLTWTAIFLYFVCIVLFIIYLNDKANAYKTRAALNTAKGIADVDNQDLQTYYGLKGSMIGMCIIGGLSLLGLLCYFNRIRMAIAVIKTAALFVMEVPSVMLVPPIFSILVMGYWGLWIISFFYIYSMGDIKGSSDTPLATVEWNDNIRYYLIYHLFYGLWSNALLQAFSQFILASSACLWFYQHSDGQLIHFYVLESVKRSIIYHFGSLIFGALLLAIVQFIRFWLEYINYQMKQFQGDPKQPVKCFIDCLRCYASCFERFVSFINKNAFIQIALTGESFITAAKNGFYLAWNNAGQFAVTSGIGSVFCNLCKLFIAFSTTFLCYMIITTSDAYKDELNSPIVPTLLFFIISYVIGDLFMSVYGMAIDAILQCSITELELVKAKPGLLQKKRAPQPIQDFLEEHKK
ncbi:unnamed protein product [Paramecium octaurelia]|uniref:Choline transporter-like protein n=1 Tax=Paramecium octaurelia TaxID=43137 RepID=A0A8S1T624_PAROT|nr:unnamed protein product [Paramecium octaurelia]